MMITLNNLKVGEACIVKSVSSKNRMLRRFTDIGLIENTLVECVGESPAGDPKAYLIRGAVIAIRNEDCADIKVKLCGGV
ncbi:MAG: ferrous iron transport protein A [Ruminococcaceae bacterium]|nr:ferrous iron transport protein A [Oscillospiraceae bacterium]